MEGLQGGPKTSFTRKQTPAFFLFNPRLTSNSSSEVSSFWLMQKQMPSIPWKRSLYYQENQTVNDYLDSFLTLVLDAGYMDPWTLVVKFCWGLKLNVQSQIATMPFG